MDIKENSSVFNSNTSMSAKPYSFLGKNEYDISTLAQRIRADYGALSNTMSLRGAKRLAV